MTSLERAAETLGLKLFLRPVADQRDLAEAFNIAANIKAGAVAFSGGTAYVLTKAGLQAGVSLGGSKVWKDKDLN